MSSLCRSQAGRPMQCSRPRAKYLAILRRRLREGRLLELLGQGLRLCRYPLARKYARVPPGPFMATLVVAETCPCACAMCPLPGRPHGIPLDLKGWSRVLDGLVTLGTPSVALTGGEPLTNPFLPELVAAAHERGLYTRLASTGIGLSPTLAEKLVEAGLDELGISLDSPSAEVVDLFRKRSGAHAAALEALSILGKTKRRKHLLLGLACVLRNENVEELPALFSLAKKLEVDFFALNPLHLLPEDQAPATAPFRLGLTPPAARQARAHALDGHDHGFPVDNSPAFFDTVSDFAEQGFLAIPCLAPWNSLTIDLDGTAYPCWPLFLRRRLALGQAFPSPTALWRSRNTNVLRQALRHCRACCWDCQTELTLLSPRWSRLPLPSRAALR